MADGFDYDVVISGIDAAVKGLKALNRELSSVEKAGAAHAQAVNAVNDAIESLAKEYGDASADARRYYRLITEGANTQLEAELKLAQGKTRINRILAQGKNVQEAFASAIKITTRERSKEIKDLKEVASAVERAAAAEEELAEAKKKSSFSGKPSDITQALLGVANRDSDEIGAADAEAKIRAVLKAEAEAAANKKKLLNDLDSIQEEYFNAQRNREEKLAADSLALSDADMNRRIKLINELEESFKKAKENTAAENKRNAAQELADSDAALNARVKNIQKIEAAFEKARKNTASEDKKASEARIALEEEEFQKKLALAKKYLAYEEDLRSGTIDKNRASRMSSREFVDINAGSAIVKTVKESPEEYERLAAAINRVEHELLEAARAKQIFTDQAKNANAKIKEFTLSWQTMGRIVVAQIFNEAFFAIQNGIRASVSESEELYKSVAEIQTIVSQTSRGLVSYYGALESVLRVSSQINFTPDDTANAFYETLSNQIGDNVSQIRGFIQEAGNLAKVTRSTLADSADAITAVMNSYNKSVGDAAAISAELFTLVDQGRVKLEEVANHMGNVSVPASQLGVDFDNVVAALSAISIAGIPAREAMTLQRNVMFKLIDPTERMTELLQEWGVSSAQAAVAAFGFEGIIAKLAVEAEKGNEEIAALMGTIRGTRGILGLTGENFQKYKNALEASRIAQESYNETVKEYLQNPGEKFAKLQQEISNEFLRMGNTIVSLVVGLNDFIGTTKNGNSVLSEAIGLVGKLSVVLGGVAVPLLLVNTAVGALSTTVAALGASGASVAAISGIGAAIGLVVAVIVGATAAIAAFHTTAAQRFGEIQADAIEMNKGIAKAFQDGILGALDTEAQIVFAESRTALAKVADALAAVNKEAKASDAKKALSDLAAGLERLIKAFGGSDADQKMIQIFSSAQDVSDLYGDSANWTTDGIQAVTDAHDRQADAIQRVIDKMQEQRNKIMDVAAANRIALAQDITERNINAIQPDLLDPNKKARAQYEAAQGAARAGAQAADPEESRRLFEIARKFLADAERTAFETGAFGTIENHTRFFNQQESELVAMQERRLAAEDQFIARQQESLNQQKEYHRTQQQIGQAEIDKRKEMETQFQLEKAFLDEYLRQRDIIMKDKDATQGERVDRLNALNEQARQGLDKIGASNFTRNQFQVELDRNQAIIAQEALRVEEEALSKTRQDATAAVNEAKQATEQYGAAVEDLATQISTALGILDEKLKVTGPAMDPGALPSVTSDPRVAALKEEAALLAQMQQNKDTALPAEEYFAKLADINNKIIAIADQAGIQDKMLDAQLNSIYEQVRLAEAQRQMATSLTTEANFLVAELDRLTNSVSAAAAAFGAPPSPGYYAKGGPVGTDNIPAWLSKGEYVVNARATRENFDYLQAINYGGSARGYSNGGAVANTQSFNNTFHITSNNPNMQAGTIVNAIRRQIAQGKATLSKRRPY